MSLVTYTFNPANNIGKVRSFMQDTEVGSLLNRTITSALWGRRLIFSATNVNFEQNEFVGHFIHPHTASSYTSYKIVENTSSTITIRGDVSGLLPSTWGTSAVINEAVFTDQEITNFLNLAASDTRKAAALGLRALASNRAKLAKKFRKEGLGGIEIQQRELSQIIGLAESLEKQANTQPSVSVVSIEMGAGKRADDFNTQDMDEFGNDDNEYLTQ